LQFFYQTAINSLLRSPYFTS